MKILDADSFVQSVCGIKAAPRDSDICPCAGVFSAHWLIAGSS